MNSVKQIKIGEPLPDDFKWDKIGSYPIHMSEDDAKDQQTMNDIYAAILDMCSRGSGKP